MQADIVVQHPPRHALPAELLRSPQRVAREPPPEIVILRAPSAQGARPVPQRPSPWKRQRLDPAPHHRQIAWNLACHDRQPRRHRLHEHHAEALSARRRRAVHVRRLQIPELVLVGHTAHEHHVLQAPLSHDPLALGIRIPGAHHDQPQVGPVPLQLAVRQAAGTSTPSALSARPRNSRFIIPSCR